MKIDKEIQYKINMIACLIDLQDQYLTELSPMFQYGLKKMINEASKHTKRFIREVDRILPEDSAYDFGSTCDDLREIIEDSIKI